MTVPGAAPHPPIRDVVLVTMNARHTHASAALRYLKANLGPHEERCAIVESTIDARPVELVERVLRLAPKIVGVSIYVWNVAPLTDFVRALKRVAPDVIVVVGGPEVSHEVDAQEVTARADYVVTDEGDLAFRDLVDGLMRGRRPLLKVIAGGDPDLREVAFPYRLYGHDDLAHRTVYVEASRGCPFKCEFCLSSLDDKARPFPQDAFLAEMDGLLARGLRRFKFVDRTFNLRLEDSLRILDFFLARMRDGLFLHFEMIPDRLPDALKERLTKFPPGAVQLEVGIQTFDDDVAARISRRQDAARIEENLRFLKRATGCHVHADLIVGLPGEDLATFARGIDRLHALGPDEIQVGILKRLRGAPIARHDAAHGMVWSDAPPYEVLATAALPFFDVMRLKRFARAWDLVANSGVFPATTKLVVADGAFAGGVALADFLSARVGPLTGIARHRLALLLRAFLVEERDVAADVVDAALTADLGRDRVPRDLLPKRQARHRAV